VILVGLIAALALQPDPVMIRRIFEDALAQRRKEFGTVDPRTAQAARDLGLFLIREHDVSAARAALAEAIEIDEKLTDVAELASVSPPEQAALLWMRAAKSTDPALAARALAALGELKEADSDRNGAADFYRQSLAKEEAAQILHQMQAEAPKVKVTFKPSQKVRIVDGPFNDFIGTVAEIDMDRAKVRVMVSFFGRETPVELDFLQGEKV